MTGTRTGTPFRRFALPVICVGAIIFLCWLLRVVFDLPTTTLVKDLPDGAGPGTVFRLADGSSFNGEGEIRIGEEEIVCERCTPDGGILEQKGKAVVANPDTFKVVERGANGTKAATHKAGAEVRPIATLFFPRNNATYGDDVDQLFYLILWITGVAFILTEGFFLYCLFMFWARPGERAVYTHGNHKVEMTWTVVPAVILVTLAIVQSGMWTKMKIENPQPGEAGVVTAQVVGMQFNWWFRQPGIDGKFGTIDDITAGELVVPARRKVRLELRSQDVIHSFFLPNYRLKQDVVPGLAIPSWFEALRPGTFQIMCAELCGLGHTKMAAKLIVKTPEEYDAWVKERSAWWANENDGQPRPDWGGQTGKYFWWWDRNPTETGFSGMKEKKRT